MHLESLQELNSTRLLLRKLCQNDKHALFTIRKDEQVNRFVNRGLQKHVDEAEAFIQNINAGIDKQKWLYWAICIKPALEMVGTICLWHFNEKEQTAEIGYELNPQFQGKGIMSEALKVVLNFAFKHLHLIEIKAFTHRENAPSTNLLIRNHFSFLHEAENEDVVFYLTNNRFLNSL